MAEIFRYSDTKDMCLTIGTQTEVQPGSELKLGLGLLLGMGLVLGPGPGLGHHLDCSEDNGSARNFTKRLRICCQELTQKQRRRHSRQPLG